MRRYRYLRAREIQLRVSILRFRLLGLLQHPCSQSSSMSGAEQVARTAKESFDASQLLDSAERHKALIALKDALTMHKDEILKANRLDIEVCTTH